MPPIDEEHNNAIRAEVGERLRIILYLEGRQKVPRPIRQSLDRLAELDHGIELKTSIDCAFGKPRLAPPTVAKAVSLICVHAAKLRRKRQPSRVPRTGDPRTLAPKNVRLPGWWNALPARQLDLSCSGRALVRSVHPSTVDMSVRCPIADIWVAARWADRLIYLKTVSETRPSLHSEGSDTSR